MILEVVRKNGLMVSYCKKEYRKDREIIGLGTEALKQNQKAYAHLHKSLKSDKQFILQAVELDANIYSTLSKSQNPYVYDKDIIRATLNGRFLEFSTTDFQLRSIIEHDEELTKIMIEKFPYTFAIAKKKWKDNKVYVLKLLKKSKEYWYHLEDQMILDKEVFWIYSRNYKLI
eukprot:gene3758-6646_t